MATKTKKKAAPKKANTVVVDLTCRFGGEGPGVKCKKRSRGPRFGFMCQGVHEASWRKAKGRKASSKPTKSVTKKAA